MDAMATRGWGIAVSGAMILIALALAFTAPQPRASSRGPERPPPIAAAVPHGEMFEARAPTTLVVHFRGRGPLARAERLQSSTRVNAELSRQRAFRGLCFASFAPQGVVLRACDDSVLTGWRPRLRAMRAVARVERGD